MAIYVFKDIPEDGSKVVKDDADGRLFALRPGVWETIAALPEGEQRPALEQAVKAAHQTDEEKAAQQADLDRYQMSRPGEDGGDKGQAAEHGVTVT